MGFTLAALAWKLWSTAAATHRCMWYVSRHVEWLNCVQRWTLFATCLRWCGCLCVRVRYYNYAGKTCNGSVVCSSTSRSKWCRIACIHWNFTHGLCVVQFSNHSMYYKPQNTWPRKRPHSFMKHATNIIRVAAKWNPLGNFALTLLWLETKYLWAITDQNF